MATDGSSGTLAYSSPASGGFNAVQVRLSAVGYSWEVIATESHASRHRAFYPHKRAVSGFAIQLELKGYNEFRAFMTFMGSYIKTFMSADRRSMLVTCPARRFARWGIPVQGVYDGDHVGTAKITPTIFFEGMMDPLDTHILVGGEPETANPVMGGVSGDQAKFFYPFSEGSLNPNTKPETLYDSVGPPTSAQEILNPAGAANNVGNVVGGALDQLGRAQDDRGRGAGR